MLKSKYLTNYYPFEWNANDAVGGNNFTVSWATLESGKMWQQYNFDGTNDYLYSSNWIALNAWTSVCMWIDFSNPNTTANYFLWENTAAYWVRYTPWSPTWTLLFIASLATSANYTTLSYNFPASICHLAIVRTANRNVDWYINWVKIWSSDPWNNNALTIRSIWRRASSSEYRARCKIDDISFFSSALEQNNIKRIMLWMHPL